MSNTIMDVLAGGFYCADNGDPICVVVDIVAGFSPLGG